MRHAPLTMLLVLLIVLGPFLPFVTAQTMDFTIDLLTPAKTAYGVGESPELWARVLNTGPVTIDPYDLEGQFTVISPSGTAIAAGTGWSTMTMQTSQISMIINTDNRWTIPSNAEAGLYALSVDIRSRSSGVSRSQQLPNAFSISAPPAADFQLSVSPGSQTVIQGQSVTFEVTVQSLNGWTTPVSLSISGLPYDATHSLNPNPVVPTATSSLYITAGTSAGLFSFVVVGDGGGRQHTTTATLMIEASTQPQNFDFSIELLVPAENSYDVGNAPELWARVVNTGTAVIDAYDLEGQFTVVSPSGMVIPAGMGWSTMTMQTGQISMIINTDNRWTIPSNAETGLYALRVSVTSRSAGVSHSRELASAFSVGGTSPPDFELEISPTSQVVAQGLSTTFEVTVKSLNGWTAPVSLSVSGLPFDFVWSLAPNPVTPTGTSSLQITTSTSTGQFQFVVIGDSGGRQHTTPGTVVVSGGAQQFEFGISTSRSSATVQAGESIEACIVTVDLVSGNTGRVDLSLSGLPSSVGAYSFSPLYDNPTFTSTLTIATLSGASPRDYALTITGSGGGKSHSVTFTLTVAGQSSDLLSVEITSPPSPANGATVTSLPITFRVRVTSQGQPVSAAQVIFECSDGGTGTIGTAASDVNGYATVTGFQSLGLGSTVRWWATAEKTGYQEGVSPSWSFSYQTGTGQKHELSVEWILDGVVSKTEKFEYDAGADATLQAPDSMNGMGFLYWVLDGSDRRTTYDITVGMDGPHTAAAVYAGKSGLSSLGNDVKNAYVEGVNGERVQLVDKDSMKLIMKSVSAGLNAVKIYVKLAYATRAVLFPLGPILTALILYVDAVTFIQIYNDDTLSPEQKVKELSRIVAGMVTKIATTVICGIVTLAATPVLGAACFLGATIGSILFDLHVDEWLVLKINEAAEWLSKNVQSIMSYLYKKVFQTSGGSSIALVVVDPSNRRLGAIYEGGAWKTVQEISNGYYSGLGSHPQYIAVPDPGNGMYRVLVTGNQTGDYQLETSIAVNGEVSSVETLTGYVNQAQVEDHTLLVTSENEQVIVNPSPIDVAWYGYRFPMIAVFVATLLIAGVFFMRRKASGFVSPLRTRRMGFQQALVTTGRRCPKCGLMNRPTAAFCKRDGTRLSPTITPSQPVTLHRRSVCPKCGYKNRPTARFCVRDRTPLGSTVTTRRAPATQRGLGVVCTRCGTRNRPGAAYCKHCRFTLN